MKIKYKDEQFTDLIRRLYQYDNKFSQNYYDSRVITFQVTEDCPMNCSYCYQGNKSHKMMSKDIAKKSVDLLFKLYEENTSNFINKNTKSIVLDFIGGEPFINIDIIDYICTYFFEKCIQENHPWTLTWMATMTTNGVLYFNKKVQKFLQKFKGFISINITLDGPKEIHDKCRVYHDGLGTFDDAYKAFKHFNKNYSINSGTKVTISPDNLKDINKIIDFFINEKLHIIHANCTFEHEWTIEEAKIFYSELIKMADQLLKLNDGTTVSLFDKHLGQPLSEEYNENWCGGTGNMLAFDTEGLAYPCIRYMSSSLNNEQSPLVIGSVNGLQITDLEKDNFNMLNNITRRSQSSDECYYCSIARGCAWCSGWNYQKFGTPNKRCTNICIMHKARVLANVYYWNKQHRLDESSERFKLNLSKEECLKIIDENEYNKLLQLSQ